jgi:hypothetical protein
MCFLGIIGCSSSKATTSTTIENNIVNENDFNSTSKTLMEAAVNVLVKNANSCSSSVNQNNSCTLNNVNSAGPVTLGGPQTNKATINFSCIQSSSASSEMASAMMQKVGAELKSANNSDLASVAQSAAKASQESGFLSGGGKVESADNTKITNNVANITRQNIENIFERNLKNNFNSETVDECIGKSNQSNKVAGSNIKTASYVNAECQQTNSVEQVAECKQLSEAINKTAMETAQALGYTVQSASETKMTTESKSETSVKNIATGPIQEIGTAISGIVGSVGNLFGLASLGMAAPFILICCGVCCCVLLSCIVSLVFASKSSDGTGSTSGTSGTTNISTVPTANNGTSYTSTQNNPSSGSNMTGGFFNNPYSIEMMSYSLLSDILTTSDF